MKVVKRFDKRPHTLRAVSTKNFRFCYPQQKKINFILKILCYITKLRQGGKVQTALLSLLTGCEHNNRTMKGQKMKDKSKNFSYKESHNVYYAKPNYKEQWRIRIYHNDHKYYEKQIHLPHLSFFSITEEVLVILRMFANKISSESEKKDKVEYWNEEIINKMNRAYFIGNMLEMLRGNDDEQ